MNLENPSTLEKHDLPETDPRFRTSGPPPSEKPRRHGWLWIIVLIVAVLALLYYFRLRGNSASAAATASTTVGGRPGRGGGVIPVVGVRATKGDIGVYFNGLGAVTPIYTVTVKSQISGYLMQVLYREGQIVQKGQSLAEIDPRPYQVMLEQAQAGLARDEANLANAQVDLQRYQTLAPLKAIPEQQLATQQALVKQDQATIQTDRAQIDAAKLDLTYCHVTAPITGRVGLRLVDPGNYVTPSDATGLVVITQIQPISVIFTLPEDQLPEVIKSMRAGVRLKVEAFDRDMLTMISQGWLSTIDNLIDPTTGTVKLRADFSNGDGSLFPNQFVNARLLVEEKRGVTLIPTACVQRNSQETYVYVVNNLHAPKPNPQAEATQGHAGTHAASATGQVLDGTVTVKTITVGTTEGEESEVTSGLVPGNMVVMTGVDKLQEGSKVRVEKPAERSSKGSS